MLALSSSQAKAKTLCIAPNISIAALFLRCTAWGDNGSRAASGSLGDYANSVFVNFLVTFVPIQLPS
jgi:hypothetical protein